MYALNTGISASRPRPAVMLAPAVREVSIEAIFQTQTSERFAPGTAVFWEGDKANDLFQVAEGILRLYRILPDGRRAIIGFVFAGDLLGLSFRKDYLFTAEAVTEVAVRRFSRARFHALVNESPELRPQLVGKLCDEMCAAQDQMLLLLHRNADARVAGFFLAVARKTAGGATKATEVSLAMSRTDMADYLGLTIETVCRSIGKLKNEGMITLKGPHKVVLQKPKALRELAGEEDGELAEVSRVA